MPDEIDAIIEKIKKLDGYNEYQDNLQKELDEHAKKWGEVLGTCNHQKLCKQMQDIHDREIIEIQIRNKTIFDKFFDMIDME